LAREAPDADSGQEFAVRFVIPPSSAGRNDRNLIVPALFFFLKHLDFNKITHVPTLNAVKKRKLETGIAVVLHIERLLYQYNKSRPRLSQLASSRALSPLHFFLA
jgi:hypothetical protein